ncbi:MAG: hypothetical protein GF355_05470, partial [Candidatus Eisenbacteria bacterium]|nr:hypothetical protein [Candidatus Eisenbacteria bacterium]
MTYAADHVRDSNGSIVEVFTELRPPAALEPLTEIAVRVSRRRRRDDEPREIKKGDGQVLDKIGVIGSGWIGGVLVQELVRRKLAKTVAVTDPAPFVNPDDPPEKQDVQRKQSVAKGKALDIAEGSPLVSGDVHILASKEYDVLEGSDMILNTAGVPRKARPDGTFPSREELLEINLKVTNQVADAIQKYCKSAMIISIANPLDAIVYTLNQRLKPPKKRLMGMAGVLDSSRYRYFIAEAANVSVDNVEALVLGGHGDNMVPVRSCTRIAGMPV